MGVIRVRLMTRAAGLMMTLALVLVTVHSGFAPGSTSSLDPANLIRHAVSGLCSAEQVVHSVADHSAGMTGLQEPSAPAPGGGPGSLAFSCPAGGR